MSAEYWTTQTPEGSGTLWSALVADRWNDILHAEEGQTANIIESIEMPLPRQVPASFTVPDTLGDGEWKHIVDKDVTDKVHEIIKRMMK